MIHYTKSQKQAIFDQKPGNILVSASAGSGKTRVLVDRVIHKLEQGIGIDHLLIVTFTRAAAKEMRDRIQLTLRQKLSQTTDHQKQNWFITQLRKVPVANISTLDAFCQRIIQHYYYIINLDPNFRILNDNTERDMMRDHVWQDVREELYANDQNGMFAKLTENFSSDRDDDGLMELVYLTYDYANVNQQPDAWLNSLLDLYQVRGPLTKSNFYQQHLLKILLNAVQNVELSFHAALRLAKQEDSSKDAELLEHELDTMQKYEALLKEKNWNELRDGFRGMKFKTLPAIKKDTPADQKQLHNQVKNLRNTAKQQFNKISTDFFELPEQQHLEIMGHAYDLVHKLIQVVHAFSDAYQNYKRSQHVLEFIDLEHEALNILSSPKDKAVAVRKNLRQQFNEIMVDEYQDNNRLQDSILTSIANPQGNLFMVGDVKQSIYRFRLADPQIFMGRSKKYQNDPHDNSREIHLAENFRSDRSVVSFINMIFKQIMDEKLGGINYYDLQNPKHPNVLKVGAKYYPAGLTAPTDLLIYNSQNQPSGIEAKIDDHLLTTSAMRTNFKIKDSAQGQIEIVAQKIQTLMQKHVKIFDRKQGQMRPIQYRDIAILAATRNNNLVIADLFNQYHIPVHIDDSKKYFKTTEIQIMMSLLSIIDNPYQDIPLVAVLRSPMVAMDENQMAYLRINQRTGDYFKALKYFYHQYGNTIATSQFGDRVYAKVDDFLKLLTDFRNVSQQHALVDLIWYIYQQTGFLDYVGGMPSGKQRQANLHALYDRAAEYEKTSFKGLFQFVRFVHRMQDHDDDLAEAEPSHVEDAVSVMTIHGSKGLEFPVVFLIDVSHRFNMNNIRGGYVLNDKLGLGISYLDPDQRVNVDTLQKQVIAAKEANANLSEEMRKLYVAMTRAEQRLFIVGAIKNAHRLKKDEDPKIKLLRRWENEAASSNGNPDDPRLNFVVRSQANSDLDLIGPALVRQADFQKQWGTKLADTHPLAISQAQFKLQFYSEADLAPQAPKLEKPTPVDLNSTQYNPKRVNAQSIDKILNLKYPDEIATHTTAYQSVSEIKRLFDDPDNVALGNFNGSLDPIKTNRYTTQNFARPQFMQTVQAPQSTDIGTAVHLILQKINVQTQITDATIIKLVNHLVTNQLITPEVAAKIEPAHIRKFYSSKIGQLILKHPTALHREVPFSLLISANQIFKGFHNDATKKVLIHGIIDGYLNLKDQVILFDYKTDYVKNRDDHDRINKIIQRYQGQVNLYGIALSKILQRPVKKRYLYLLAIDQLVALNN